MNMQKRGARIQKEWLLFLILLILLYVFYISMTLILVENFALAPIIWLTVGYLFAFVVLSVIFTRRLRRATYPRELIEAREQGIAASAKVLEIKRTRWRNPPTRNFRLQVSPARYEHEMRVRVKPDNAPEYETELAEYLSGDEIPTQGDTISVKIHPQSPEIVVIARDKPT